VKRDKEAQHSRIDQETPASIQNPPLGKGLLRRLAAVNVRQDAEQLETEARSAGGKGLFA
jgi:hypothetical protein